ncbi:MAG TPA: hypothetical protein VNO31_04525 [Umezawaea sp.]|nr:hypothetical protein [Umezawaea sp.]
MAAGDLLTADGQIEWRGTILGRSSPYGWDELTGWFDLPAQRGSNAPLSGFHGSFPGRKVSTDRIVTWNYKSRAAGLGAFQTAMDELRRITAPTEDPVEEPLVIRLDGESLLAWARCTRRIIPTGRHYGLGRAHGSLQWEATDPRLYLVDEQSESTRLATPAGGGLDFSSGGLDFGSGGLDFGTGVTGGRLIATALGHVPTWPRLEILGPVVGPLISFPGDRQLRFAPTFAVAAGQKVVISTQPSLRTVEVMLASATTGVNVKSQLWTKEWTPLLPGVPTEIRYAVQDASNYNADTTLTAWWRSAKH